MWEERDGWLSACMISGIGSKAGGRSKLCVDKKC